MVRLSFLGALMLAAAARIGAAQEYSGEVHGEYSRTTVTHTSSGGAGVQVEAVWGGSTSPVKLGTTLGGDWLKEEAGGPSQWSLGYDATLQPGGSSAITPYAGGNISANWYTGNNSPGGTHYGLQYIIGVQIKSKASAKSALTAEIRPGYVKTQEHSITYRLGYSHQM